MARLNFGKVMLTHHHYNIREDVAVFVDKAGHIAGGQHDLLKEACRFFLV